MTERAAILYAQHCAACHGENGNGEGAAARFLEPKPRNLRDGKYRIISSTTVSAASAEDVMSVLTRGMPGSSMPGWAHLSVTDRMLLVGQVLAFRKEGARDKAIASLQEEGEDVTEQAISKFVSQLPLTPGKPLTVSLSRPTSEAISHGKAIYTKACASCHGVDGKGDGVQKMLTSEGFVQRPRDLTKGIFKGEHDALSIFRRLRLGMPGSAMPANPLMRDKDIEDLTHYVLSLSDESSRQSFVTRRRAIPATKVESLPVTIDDVQWKEARSIKLVAFPIWWRDFANPDLTVQSLHDGKDIALRIRWNDATRDVDPYRPEDFEDLVAMQLYQGDAEPFLGMGSRDSRVDVWMWRASWLQPWTPTDSIMDEYPFDRPIYDRIVKGSKESRPDFLTSRAAGNLHSDVGNALSASNLAAGGFRTLGFRPKASQIVTSTCNHKNGAWTVVFKRPMKIAAADGKALVAGEKCSVAFAIWDGARKDRDGQKLITIWHDLKIE